MSRLNPSKLHVTWGLLVRPEGPITPRRYTLTHSDATGDLFLTIAARYDWAQTRGLYTRLMRDEVLAQWQERGRESSSPGESGRTRAELHAFCHVSGGIVFGGPAMRDAIFRRELPLVLEAFRYGDDRLFQAHPELDEAPVMIHFQSHLPRYRRIERWGVAGDYRI